MSNKSNKELNEQELDTVSGGVIPSRTRETLTQLFDVEKGSTLAIRSVDFKRDDGTTVTLTTADGSPIIIKGT